MAEDVEKLTKELEDAKAELEELKRVKTPPVVKIESPLERDEFEDFLDVFMSATAVQDRRKAALLAARALKNLGSDPETHLEEAVKTARFITEVLNSLPDSELAKQTKDLLVAEAAGKVGEAAYKESTPDDRMERRMERMMEMIMPWKMAMAMFGGAGFGGEGQGKSKEIEDIKSEFSKLRDDIRAEKASSEISDRFSKLEAKIDGLGAKKSEDGEGVGKKIDELKAALEKPKESEVVKKLDELTKALTEKEESDKFEGMMEQVTAMKSGLEAKIASLQTSMNEGKPKENVMSQVTELMNSFRGFYKDFGETAKVVGFEAKDDKVTGEFRKDLMTLGKDIIKVVGKAVEYRGEAPPKGEVKTLPPPGSPVIIPVASQQPPQEVPAEALQAPPTAAPFAKKPKPPEAAAPSKPETPPQEAPQETKGS